MLKQSHVVDVSSINNHSADKSKVDLVEWYFEQGWTDGLPVVPPTPEKMAAMLEALGAAPIWLRRACRHAGAT